MKGRMTTFLRRKKIIPRKRSRIDKVSFSSISSPRNSPLVQHAFHVLRMLTAQFKLRGLAEVTF